jgi:hypothetical protein
MAHHFATLASPSVPLCGARQGSVTPAFWAVDCDCCDELGRQLPASEIAPREGEPIRPVDAFPVDWFLRAEVPRL